MAKRKRYALLAVASWGIWGLGTADIYKYRDANGIPVFSDKPLKGHYRFIWRSKTVGQISSYSPPDRRRLAPSRRRKAGRAAAIQRSPLHQVGGISGGGGWDPEAFRRRVARYAPFVAQAAKKVRVRPELLHAVIRAESGYRPDAVSRRGAIGLMQLLPETAKRYGVDPHDPRQNIEGGARYLRDLLQHFGFDLKLALAGYNAGENAVVRHGNRVPPFPETQRYVKKVLAFYMQNRVETASQGETAGQPRILGDIN